ncbi:hypothetical protein L204_105074 [Cryptococcus depauperatus]|nr:hypothetical protein L204_03723 [Cryptococcus depauperatus CBS 7855]
MGDNSQSANDSANISRPASRASQLDPTADTSSATPGGQSEERYPGEIEAPTAPHGAPRCRPAELFRDTDDLGGDNRSFIHPPASTPPSSGSVHSHYPGETLGGRSHKELEPPQTHDGPPSSHLRTSQLRAGDENPQSTASASVQGASYENISYGGGSAHEIWRRTLSDFAASWWSEDRRDDRRGARRGF